MNLYMAVTTDIYELPLIVGTAAEIAKWAGCRADHICRSALYAHKYNGKNKGYKIIKVQWG